MAAKSTLFATDLLKLIYNGTAFATANLAQNAGSPLTVLFLSLHTSSPGAGGNQMTNEVQTSGYGQYTRVSVARDSSGFTVGSGSVTLTTSKPWTGMTSGTGNVIVTHFGVGTTSALDQAGYLIHFGTVSPNITVNNGVTPQLTAGTTITET